MRCLNTLLSRPERSFCIPLHAACGKRVLLKTKHFTCGLLTTGSYVRIPTGEPVRSFEHIATKDCCESAKLPRAEIHNFLSAYHVEVVDPATLLLPKCSSGFHRS